MVNTKEEAILTKLVKVSDAFIVPLFSPSKVSTIFLEVRATRSF